MPNHLGSTTKRVFVKLENHKLHCTFEVATSVAVKKGQPVMLATGGKITPATSMAKSYSIIGTALHDRAAGEECTVNMKASMVIDAASAQETLVAGPVAYEAWDDTNKLHTFLEVKSATHTDATNIAGWALNNGDTGDAIQVALL